MKAISQRCFQALPILCALSIAGCATTHGPTEADAKQVARQIQVGMRPEQVRAIIMANRPPPSSPDFAPAFSIGALSGDRSYIAHRLNREFVIDVTYEYMGSGQPARGAQEEERVTDPATARREPISTLQ